MNLKKLLASSCRQKIIIELSWMKKTNVMELVRSINSTYNEVDRNLRILELENIVISQRVGHSRILALNYENNKTTKLLKALAIIDDITRLEPASIENLKKI